MAFFVKRKSAPTDVPVVHDISKAQIDSPKAIVSTKAPPPSYSVTDVTTKSSPSTLEPTTSNVYSPDEFTGAIRQPTVSGENMVVARHQATPVNDGQLPEVVVHSTGNTSTTQSLMSESHLSLNTSSMTLQEVKTVTPLHLLGDQSDYVDCPFCRRRVETRVQKDPSTATHASAAGLFLVSIGGVVVPYKRQWKHHVTHFCTNCTRKIAQQRYGATVMQPLGTPEHLREASRFPPAAPNQDT